MLHTITRWPVLQKVRGHPYKGLPQLVGKRFQVLFHSPSGVLFTFPSRYYALSVTREYLALGGGPPSFPQGFSCPVVLWSIVEKICCFVYGTFTLCGGAFQLFSTTTYLFYMTMSATPVTYVTGLGSSPFARRYLGNRFFFLFLRVLRCFSSPGMPFSSYVFTTKYLSIISSRFPHSDIPGSMLACSFPRLFAAYHVLLRLLVPRHPPFALNNLTFW